MIVIRPLCPVQMSYMQYPEEASGCCHLPTVCLLSWTFPMQHTPEGHWFLMREWCNLFLLVLADCVVCLYKGEIPGDLSQKWDQRMSTAFSSSSTWCQRSRTFLGMLCPWKGKSPIFPCLTCLCGLQSPLPLPY